MSLYQVHSDTAIEAMAAALRRRLRSALILGLATILISTIGFMVFDRHKDLNSGERILYALWDTLNLVSTVGSLHFDEYTVWQRLWAIGVIIFGLGAVLYGFSTIQAIIHGDAMRALYRESKMKKDFKTLENHIVVCGFGQVGRQAAHSLDKAGAPFVVVELNPERAVEADAAGYIVVEGDATQEHTLRRVQLERATGLMATINSDEANVYLTLLSREINPKIRIVARAERVERRKTMERAGANRVIVPGETAGIQLTQLILNPNVSAFIEAAMGEGDYDFVEVEVRQFPGLKNRTLKDLNLPERTETIVIAVVDENGHQEFNPDIERELHEEDSLILVARIGGLERLAQL